ncbi:hypothetical protein HHX47_DHR10000413 [Lentinula edodes]|nr:hypothetical protein HHX47_DHR10000413 [Lentinula edodes]
MGNCNYRRSWKNRPGDTDSETDEKPDLTSLRAEVCSGFLEGSLSKVTSIQEYEIKPKIKAEMNIDSNTFRERIARVSAPRYPVTLEPESARWQIMSRKFISRTYGGSEVSTFPMIDPKKVSKHGREFWMFWSLEKHPDAPKRPGKPGIWYDSSPMEYTEDFEIVQHGFARMNSDKWLYLGDYKQCATEALTQCEWLLQSDKKKPWARHARAGIHLRKKWSREPTMEEIADAAMTEDFKNVTIEEIKDAFDQGQQRLGMLVLKCVGYDNDFQKELIDKFSSWIPPAKKTDSKGSKATSNTHTKQQAPKRKQRAKRGKKKQIESEDDSEGSGSFKQEELTDADGE